ncbi:MAG TPA: dihydropteroate synthase [Candidatus Saccharimonadales bacterium]|nr:dihydropteroate synthase [Candidatus Saccharimonadales bacterium]
MVELVGILNITPDSFSDGGDYVNSSKAIARAMEMIEQGASFIDIGAESTNPRSSPLQPDEEWQRLQAVLPVLVQELPGKISVDTYHAETARKALENGITIINDVTMFRDPAMIDLAVQYKDKVRYIISHLSPAVHSIAEAHRTMPTKSVEEVNRELLAKRQELVNHGVSEQNIIIDPGIGFGKSDAKNWELNWELLSFAKEVPGIDVMIGYSRKRFLGEHRMEVKPNLEAAKIAIASGAKYLRVHDVAAHATLL